MSVCDWFLIDLINCECIEIELFDFSFSPWMELIGSSLPTNETYLVLMRIDRTLDHVKREMAMKPDTSVHPAAQTPTPLRRK